MEDERRSLLTRRQMGRGLLAAGAMAGLRGPLWAWSFEAPEASGNGSVLGPDSLRAHAAGKGLLYGAAVNPALLDVEGVAAGRSADALHPTGAGANQHSGG